MQSFGSYDTPDEAAIAYDVGYILFRGLKGKINHPIDNYIDQATGYLHEDLQIPGQVDQSVRRYLESNKFGHEHKVSTMERIVAFWSPGKCPFYHV
jgi:hypothetical protein